jgi:hypothetical protein
MFKYCMKLQMIKITFLLFLCISIHACKTESARPDDALGTARAFIRYSLDGEFKQADELMLEDSINRQELEQIKKRYQNDLSKQEKLSFQKASIIIHTVDQLNDSIVVINYSNSYTKKQMPIKVIRRNDLWQVDLQYTFSGNL